MSTVLPTSPLSSCFRELAESRVLIEFPQKDRRIEGVIQRFLIQIGHLILYCCSTAYRIFYWQKRAEYIELGRLQEPNHPPLNKLSPRLQENELGEVQHLTTLKQNAAVVNSAAQTPLLNIAYFYDENQPKEDGGFPRLYFTLGGNGINHCFESLNAALHHANLEMPILSDEYKQELGLDPSYRGISVAILKHAPTDEDHSPGQHLGYDCREVLQIMRAQAQHAGLPALQWSPKAQEQAQNFIRDVFIQALFIPPAEVLPRGYAHFREVFVEIHPSLISQLHQIEGLIATLNELDNLSDQNL